MLKLGKKSKTSVKWPRYVTFWSEPDRCFKAVTHLGVREIEKRSYFNRQDAERKLLERVQGEVGVK